MRAPVSRREPGKGPRAGQGTARAGLCARLPSTRHLPSQPRSTSSKTHRSGQRPSPALHHQGALGSAVTVSRHPLTPGPPALSLLQGGQAFCEGGAVNTSGLAAAGLPAATLLCHHSVETAENGRRGVGVAGCQQNFIHPWHERRPVDPNREIQSRVPFYRWES